MTVRGSPRLEGYAVVAGIGLVASLALRRPELAIASAPFLLLLAYGVRPVVPPRVQVAFSLYDERVLEGEDLGVRIDVVAETAVDRLELLLELPRGVEVTDGDDAVALRLRAGEERTILLRVRCTRWGLYDLGAVELRARDVSRLLVWEERVEQIQRLKAYPRAERLRHIVPPRETQVFTGSEVARTKGDGIEYADLRHYVAGDRLRSINWRASARLGSFVVNERHPERNTDVVLFVDSFADVGGAGRSTLDDAVRATTALASRYLERRDRVGLVTFGGVLRWLQPGMGRMQRYALVETLLETGVEPTYVWRNVGVIPGRILPPKALVLGLTPFVDERYAAALAELRGRGFDVAAIEVDPVPLVAPGRSETDQLAHRIWLLQREALRTGLARLGIVVARWSEEVELETALEEVRASRRLARLARV
jgi:uncharacterized protein (DUF58 family)